jgi:hypothetical protein
MTQAKKPYIPPTAKPTVNAPAPHNKGREWFIQYLVNKNGWTSGAELGIWRGRTFLHLLEHCPQLTVIGVDLWAPQPDNPGPENWVDWPHQKYEAHVRKMSQKFGERAVIIKDTTDNAAEQVEDNSLDFVFIDADHSTDAVERDIRTWHPKVKDTGWIIGHDINWDTVCPVVEHHLPGYIIGPDNVWARPKGRLGIIITQVEI